MEPLVRHYEVAEEIPAEAAAAEPKPAAKKRK